MPESNKDEVVEKEEVKKPTIKDMLDAQNAITGREAETTEAKIKALFEGDKKRSVKRATKANS